MKKFLVSAFAIAIAVVALSFTTSKVRTNYVFFRVIEATETNPALTTLNLQVYPTSTYTAVGSIPQTATAANCSGGDYACAKGFNASLTELKKQTISGVEYWVPINQLAQSALDTKN